MNVSDDFAASLSRQSERFGGNPLVVLVWVECWDPKLT